LRANAERRCRNDQLGGARKREKVQIKVVRSTNDAHSLPRAPSRLIGSIDGHPVHFGIIDCLEHVTICLLLTKECANILGCPLARERSVRFPRGSQLTNPILAADLLQKPSAKGRALAALCVFAHFRSFFSEIIRRATGPVTRSGFAHWRIGSADASIGEGDIARCRTL